MSNNHYDIAIIGAGAAGLQLALVLRNDPHFAQQRILLLEKDGKDTNDHTWCYWEKGAGQWDALLRQSWSQGDFFSETRHRPLDLLPYRYKMLRADDFYRFAKTQLAAAPNLTWQTDEIVTVEQGDTLRIIGKSGTYTATHVFDSRLPVEFSVGSRQSPVTNHQPPITNHQSPITNHQSPVTSHQPPTTNHQSPVTNHQSPITLLQHFKGWLIRTPDDRFDTSRFTMMDYRLRWPGTSSFTYVLPTGPREAMVEFTLFSHQLLNDGDYDQMLRQYIDKVLKIKEYEVEEVEWGIIPMTDFPFEKYSVGNHVRIGTAGGWVKPSSGYSFKNCERNARKIVENLKAGRPANEGMFSDRFRFYDSVFLGVLDKHNDLGPSLFETMYLKNDVQKILAFLDDETSLMEELGIIWSFPKGPFLQSAWRWIGHRLNRLD